MLVLTRKHQEKIRIGDDIVITVLRTKGKAVRLGIEAPNSVPVIRGELAFELDDSAHREADSEFASVEAGDEHAAAARPVNGSRVRAADRTWPSDSSMSPKSERWPVEPKVSLQRVSREKLAEALPHIASHGGPLRSMLDQRSSM